MITALEVVGTGYVNVYNENGNICTQIMLGSNMVGQPQFNGNYITITYEHLIEVYKVEDSGYCTRVNCLYR